MLNSMYMTACTTVLCSILQSWCTLAHHVLLIGMTAVRDGNTTHIVAVGNHGLRMICGCDCCILSLSTSKPVVNVNQ